MAKILCEFGNKGATVVLGHDYHGTPRTRVVGRYVIANGELSYSFFAAGLRRAITCSRDGKYYWRYHPKRFVGTPLSEREEAATSMMWLAGENW